MLVWLCSLPLLTIRRAPVFSSDVNLWTDAAVGSQKPRPWLNLASALMQAQRYEDARVALTIGHDLAPARPQSEIRIDDAYWTLLAAQWEAYTGRWANAQTYLASLIAREPTWPLGHELCAQVNCSHSD